MSGGYFCEVSINFEEVRVCLV